MQGRLRMRRRFGALIGIAFVAACAVGGCGGPTTEVALGLELANIPDNVRHFKIRFHTATRECKKVLDEPDVMGTINKEASLEVLTAGGLEIDEILEAAGSRSTKKRSHDGALVKHVALAMGGILLAIAVSGGVIQSVGGQLRGGEAESEQLGELLPQERAGFLQVVVDPWAEVYVDGQLLTVTPSAERFMLAPGRHFVKLVHPQYQPVTREIDIERGKPHRLKVALSTPLAKLGSAKP